MPDSDQQSDMSKLVTSMESFTARIEAVLCPLAAVLKSQDTNMNTKNLINEMRSFSASITSGFLELKTAIKDMSIHMETLDQRMVKIESSMNSRPINPSFEPASPSYADVVNFPPLLSMAATASKQAEATDEMLERRGKAMNLVIRDMPECAGRVVNSRDNGEGDELSNADLQWIRDVARQANGNDDDANLILRCFRMGNPKYSKTRLIKVITCDVNLKHWLMSHSGRSSLASYYQTQLKLQNIPKIHTRHDLTEAQRTLQSAAYRVKSALKAKSPDQDFVLMFNQSSSNPVIGMKVNQNGYRTTKFYCEPFSPSTLTSCGLDLSELFPDK